MGKRRSFKAVAKATQEREQLRSLRVVETPQVLQQLYHQLSHNTAKQSSFQQNIDSYIYQSRSIQLSFEEDRNNSDRTWLNSVKVELLF
jgi:hypothetical protein